MMSSERSAVLEFGAPEPGETASLMKDKLRCWSDADHLPRRTRLIKRNRKFVDSPLEGTGFELVVRGRGEAGCRAF